jgi:hypothetical protein
MISNELEQSTNVECENAVGEWETVKTMVESVKIAFRSV